MENEQTANIYYDLIVKGEKTINSVPKSAREIVVDRLIKNNHLDLVESDH